MGSTHILVTTLRYIDRSRNEITVIFFGFSRDRMRGSGERKFPYRSRPPRVVLDMIRGKTTLPPCFLLDQPGPTKFVVRRQDTEERRLVLIGRENQCSCENVDCVHILFVMTKVLRLDLRDPIIWQRSLVDREVNQILTRRRRIVSRSTPRRVATTTTTTTSTTTTHTIKRRDLKDGDELCAICQDEMTESDVLTWCRSGCGHNLHVTCMQQNAKFRKANGDDVTCPFCRTEWGEIIGSRMDGKRVSSKLVSSTSSSQRRGQGSTVHTGIECNSCSRNPIFGNRYRCLLCEHDVNLCKRCYQSRRQICKHHPFIWKAVTTSSWLPARRTSFQVIDPQVVAEMQRRELSDSDLMMLQEYERRQRVQRLDEFLVDAMRKYEEEDLPPGHLHGKPQCMICSNTNFGVDGAMEARVLPCCGKFVHRTCASSLMLSENPNCCPNVCCPRGVIFPGWVEDEVHHHHVERRNSSSRRRRRSRRCSSRSRRASASSYDNLFVSSSFVAQPTATTTTTTTQQQAVHQNDNNYSNRHRTRRDDLAARVSTREQDRLAAYDRMDHVSSVLSESEDLIDRIFKIYSNNKSGEMSSRDFVRLSKSCGVARHVATVMWAKATASLQERKIRLSQENFKATLLPEFCLYVKDVEPKLLLDRMLTTQREEVVSSSTTTTTTTRRRRLVPEEIEEEEVNVDSGLDELSSLMQTSSWGRRRRNKNKNTTSAMMVMSRRNRLDRVRRVANKKKYTRKNKASYCDIKRRRRSGGSGLSVAGAMCIRAFNT